MYVKALCSYSANHYNPLLVFKALEASNWYPLYDTLYFILVWFSGQLTDIDRAVFAVSWTDE